MMKVFVEEVIVDGVKARIKDLLEDVRMGVEMVMK
jgi:hypothetical protein